MPRINDRISRLEANREQADNPYLEFKGVSGLLKRLKIFERSGAHRPSPGEPSDTPVGRLLAEARAAREDEDHGGGTD